jgi:hypothetical protein
MTHVVTRITGLLVGLVLVAGLLLAGDRQAAQVQVSPAADVGQFNPGNIISDAVFFDGDAMSVAAIARFIDLKGMNCRAGSDGTPCLKDFTQNTAARAADAYCSGYTAGTAEPAEVIIAKAARACNVNPRVLLVIMQKEQSLVTNTGSSLYANRYQKAMGYACPDTAPCNTAYYGFQNQVYASARAFQRYKVEAKSYPSYRAGRTANVLYHPNSACGRSPVYIQNQATAGLYTYTPYQPNTAALKAGYGTGNSCSAYGNRNFWLYYTDWFGSTQLPGQSAWQPVGEVESVTARTGDQVQVRGWAVDPDTSEPITVHAFVDGTAVAATTADVARGDVAALLPAWGPAHGFDATVPVPQGVHEVCVYGINVGSPAANPKLGCKKVDTRNLPMGSVETATIVEGQGVLEGWALDENTTAPIDVHVYVDGGWAAQVTAGASRPDVGAAYPGAGNAHGYSVTVPLRPGGNQVCAYAINVGPGNGNPEFGCRTLTLRVDPQGAAQVTGGATAATVSGWAVDPETAAAIDVHVYADGTFAKALTASVARPDVAEAVPGVGSKHGFRATLPLSPGKHTVCVYAINVRQGAANPQLGCSAVLVGVPPVGNLEAATAKGATVTVKGWALDRDTTAPIDVQVHVDGKRKTVVRANGARPDIAAAFPASGAAHGFTASLVMSPGKHQVCASAVNVLGGTKGNPSLGCRTVTVPPSVSPRGNVDEVKRVSGYVAVRGWTYDPDVPPTSISVHFYLDGRYAGQLRSADRRPDVAAAIRGAGDAHGFTGYLAAPPGKHTVCAYGIDTAGAVNPKLGCRTITVPK